MGFAEKLVSASVVGFLVAVLVLIVLLVSSGASYSADGAAQREMNLILPLLIGALAGAGAFVLQSSGGGRRRRPKREKPA